MIKHITITSENRAKNPKLFKNMGIGSIYTGGIPKSYNGVKNIEGAYRQQTELHEQDGWYEYVKPVPSATEKLSTEFFDEANNIFTHNLIAKTEAEIQADVLRNSETERQSLMQTKTEAKIIAEAQEITDDTEALENQALYPFWEEGVAVTEGYKMQRLVGVELRLYRVKEGKAHTTQSDYPPELTPSLWTRIGFENERVPWDPTTASAGEYDTGAEVTHNGKAWRSDVDNNAWEPGVYGWTEITE